MIILGRISHTEGVESQIEKHKLTARNILDVLYSHRKQEDKDIHHFKDLRHVSAYKINEIELYVVTEMDNSKTTVMLLSEYLEY